MNSSLVAKRVLLATAERIRLHYASCEVCGSTWRVCQRAAVLWDRAARQQVDVVRTCVSWHASRLAGAERADVLLGKMLRVVTALYAPPDPSRRGIDGVKGVRR